MSIRVLTLLFTFVFMFIRRLKHNRGYSYIQVVDKSSGKYKVLKSFGSFKTAGQEAKLIKLAENWMNKHTGKQELDFNDSTQAIEGMLNNITSHKLIGIDMVLGKIFDEIGFDQIGDGLFKDLVLYRLAYPRSKLKTTQFLSRFGGKKYTEDTIYRYMDKLHGTQKELVEQISYTHSKQVLGDDLQVVFYDVTTIYFEVDNEDGLRKTGFSKEGRHQNPQIVLGLLVGKQGYPLAYEIFPGNQFEGHTMLPVVDAFKKRYGLQQLIIVADSGLMSKNNIEELISKDYGFIIGARIKNETKKIKEKILSLELRSGESKVIEKGGLSLVVTYSDDRAKKDRYNREKGFKKLERRIKSGKLNKAHINNRGYNKYLCLEGDVKISMDQEKFEQDARWDGLKGYITNANLSKNEIIANYQHLWQIERAFRISKTDLKVRPIYHRLQRRIEAHICLNFVAYKVYKELERRLQDQKSGLSAEKVIDILQSIFQIEVYNPQQNEYIKKTLLLTDEHKSIARVFNF